MSLFDKFNNDVNYIPNNMKSKCNDSKKELILTTPIIHIDNYKNITGFTWTEKDVFDLNFSIKFNIPVRNDDIVYGLSGEAPDYSTKGIIGQRAYNIVDIKSWLCVGSNTDFNKYEWIQDDNLTFHSTTNYLLEMQPQCDELFVTIDNFRHEQLCEYTFINTDEINIPINKESLPFLVEGIYYLNVYFRDKNKLKHFKTYNINIALDNTKIRDKNSCIKYTKEDTIWQELNGGSN